MTEARPKPLVGALLGALLGLIVMALLTVLGVMPPDRLPLFGIVAVSVLLVSWLTTQRMMLAKAKFVTVIVIAAALGGVALTGIPEFARGGSLSDGCYLEGTSSLESTAVGPAGTSAIDPFDVTTTDTVSWNASSDGVLTNWSAHLNVMVGGFDIPLWNGTHPNSGESTQWSGDESVEAQLDSIQDQSGMLLTGTYHVHGSIDADEGSCDMQAYVRVQPASAFDGLLLAVLWTLLVVVIVAIVIVAVGVRRSITASDEALAMVGTSAVAGQTSTGTPPGAEGAETPPSASGDPSDSADATSPEVPAGSSDARPDEAPGTSRQQDASSDGAADAVGGDASAAPDAAAPDTVAPEHAVDAPATEPPATEPPAPEPPDADQPKGPGGGI